MSNPYFQFKQFTVWHDRCAMRVGTDGVLLGAWARPPHSLGVGEERPLRVLDVGTGTGLIALMMAQRLPTAQVVAVEIDPAAASQAADNVARSAFSSRVEVVCQDFRTWQADEGFDLVVSNPPFFTETLRSPDAGRSLARHVGGLDFDSLLSHSLDLMQPWARMALIVPAQAEGALIGQAGHLGLRATHRTEVYTRPQKACRRVLLELGREGTPSTAPVAACLEDRLFITDAAGQFTPDYISLTRDFYLYF